VVAGATRQRGRLSGVTAEPKPEPAGTRRVDVAGLDEVPPGTMLMVQVDGTDILIVNLDGNLHAMQGICSHEYFELDKGFLTGDSLTCALHLSRFDLETGEALDPPAEEPLAKYPVTVEDGRIILTLPEGPIPVNG
jgi:3-phenylpropionate/trans-cinnamate dioxygenase ferredoxin subunit